MSIQNEALVRARPATMTPLDARAYLSSGAYAHDVARARDTDRGRVRPPAPTRP